MVFQNPVSLQVLECLGYFDERVTSTYKMAIIFSDGTSDTPSFTNNVVTDWFGGNGFAARDLGRISRTLGSNGSADYLTGDTRTRVCTSRISAWSARRPATATWTPAKSVSKVRLTVTGQSTSGTTELGVFALSGQVVPTTSVLTNPVVVTANSTIDVENNAVTLGTLTNNTNSTLTVTSTGGKALTLGATSDDRHAGVQRGYGFAKQPETG